MRQACVCRRKSAAFKSRRNLLRYLAPTPAARQYGSGKLRAEGSSSVLLTEKGAWEMIHGARPMDDTRYANYRDSTLQNMFYVCGSAWTKTGNLVLFAGVGLHRSGRWTWWTSPTPTSTR